MAPPALPTLVAAVALAAVLAAAARSRGLDVRAARVARRWGVSRRVGALALVGVVAGVGSVALVGDPGRGGPGLALAAGCYLVGVLGVAVGAGNYARYRRAMATETTPTGAVEPGFVELAGEARPAGAPVETPFAGEGAVCYEWRVEERREEGWVTVALDGGGAPFHVDDGSGPVLVDPAGAERRLEAERRVAVPADEAPPERVAAFLRGRDDLGDADRDRRYVERFLPPGAEAYVLGQAKVTFAAEHPDDLVVARERAGTHLVAAGTPEEVTADVGSVVRFAGGVGLAAAVAGYVGMLVAAGVV